MHHSVSRWLNFNSENDQAPNPQNPQKPRIYPSAGSAGGWGGHSGKINEPYGPGRPSPENARRPIADRLVDAQRLLAEMHATWLNRVNEMVHGGLSLSEAERRVVAETKASELYLEWRALG